jgi:hypothetical protein
MGVPNFDGTERPDGCAWLRAGRHVGCGRSGQLLARDHNGIVHRWPGMRRVPLGLEVHAHPN